MIPLDSATITAAWQKCTAADRKAATSGTLADAEAALKLWTKFNAETRIVRQAKENARAAH